MRTILAALVSTAACAFTPLSAVAQPASPRQMTCETGPANRMFGETMWTVFSCSDNASLLLVAPNGSAAFPYYFLLAPHDTGYHISGEGTGDQKVSQAALNDLRALTRQEIEELLAATKAKK